jgi:adenosylcobyric acid synthase
MARTGRVVMVQGTASSVGKSLIVTGLCRILRQDGYRVAPFKAQNMSNNSFVTAAGGEMGRAQVVQAEAAGVEPDVCMNPILLKPEADHRSQVVVLGRPAFRLEGGDFLGPKAALWPVVTRALDELRAAYDVVVIEGAGSPAEINLRAGDIVNMRVARYAAAPVLLVGDIDRGGVFAHLYGTLALLEPEERALVRGLIVNKFRGTRALLEPGLRMIEERTGVPVLGVVPYLSDLRLADEDAVALEVPPAPAAAAGALDIAVVRLPRIANFDDFDPLAAEPDVRLRYVARAEELGAPDLIVLPGTKATVADLGWLRACGLADGIVAAAGRGTAVLGICGGYQMLGQEVRDPRHVEADEDVVPGLGLLPVVTHFEPVKATHQVAAEVCAGEGLFAGARGAPVRGYEIHMGRTAPTAGGVAPVLALRRRSGVACEEFDGAVAAGGWVAGTYLHGLFDNDALRAALLGALAAARGVPFRPGVPLDRAAQYDRLAACLRDVLDLRQLRRIIGLEAGAWAG